MSNPARPSYRLNLNRNPTQKWAEAQSVNYGGDDWGDDDYDDYAQDEQQPYSAGPHQSGGWGQRGGQAAQRSFTNPSLALGSEGTPYGQEQDRRHFSQGGLDPRYQRQPGDAHGSYPEHPEHANRSHDNPPPLHVNTHMSGSSSHPASGLSQAKSQDNAWGVPHSAPVGHDSQRSHLVNRPGNDNAYNTYGPRNTSDGGFDTAPAAHLPRQDNFSHEHPSTKMTETSATPAAADPTSPTSLPFIRPADIYKRHEEEEREKQRRSQESTRPNIDSAPSKTAGSPRLDKPSARAAQPPLGEVDQPKRTKTTLDTVAEQKNEYDTRHTGLGSRLSPDVLPTTKPYAAPTIASGIQESQKQQTPSRQASSVYTDRIDPTSASSSGAQPFSAKFASGRTPTEPSQQSYFKYSPSVRKPSGSRANLATGDNEEEDEDEDDFPNFDHGVSPKLPSGSPTHEPLPSRQQINTGSSETGLQKGQHQTSSGYGSAVRKTFDAQDNHTLSPITASETSPRSDHYSASVVSPVSDKKFGLGLDESSTTNPRGQTSAASAYKPPDKDQDFTILPATTFVPSYRRDKVPPATEEIKAPRPLGIDIPKAAGAHQGILPIATAPSTSARNPDLEMLSATRYTPTPVKQQSLETAASQAELAPPATSRSASEDWQEWQDQRRQFKAKHGLQDSNTASPALSSPTSRSESPAKGTVRDIAGRLENNTGHSSSTGLSAPESRAVADTRPLQLRNESFRPSLPGGWLSYTTNDGTAENQDAYQTFSPPPLLKDQSRTESTESIPTAKAPKTWQSANNGPIEAAFAAAAAAGTAMVGAFSGSAHTKDSQVSSEATSDDDSEAVTPLPPKFSETRDFAPSTPVTQTHKQVPKVHDERTIEAPQTQTHARIPEIVGERRVEAPQSQTPQTQTHARIPEVEDERNPAAAALQTHMQVSKIGDEPTVEAPHAQTGTQFTNVEDRRANPGAAEAPGPGATSLLPTKEYKAADMPAPLRTNKASDKRQQLPKISAPSSALSDIEESTGRPSQDSIRSVTPHNTTGNNDTDTAAHMPAKISETGQGLHRSVSIISEDGLSLPRQRTLDRGHEQPIPEQLESSTTEPSFPAVARPPIPTLTPVQEQVKSDHPQFLTHRYSWEAASNTPVKPAQPTGLFSNSAVAVTEPSVPSQPDFEKGIARDRPSTPKDAITPPSTMSPPTPQVHRVSEESQISKQSEHTPIASPAHQSTAPKAFPTERVEFKSILAFKDPSQRIRAFDDNRHALSAPSGLLEQWVSSMNTPEHSDVFRTGRLPQTSRAAGSMAIQPSPRRDVSAQSGTRPMQDDGKKHATTAGKYSGKARTVAKGIFARGKDKFRTASSSDKVPQFVRRRSSINETYAPPPPQPQTSVLSERAPQIPSPTLNTPTGEPSWSALSTKIDQMFDEPSSHTKPKSTGPDFQSVAGRNNFPVEHSSTSGQDQTWTGSTSTERPPASVIKSLPGATGTPPKSEAFPNFGTSTRTATNTAGWGESRQANQPVPQGIQGSSLVGTEHNRTGSHQRMDSLPVPRDRRPSSISDVSDISNGADDTNENILRNVSPSLENQSKKQAVPVISIQPRSKEEEALQSQDRSSTAESTLPAYSSGLPIAADKKRPSVEPGSQIVPVADLKTAESADTRLSGPRPFSFIGSETLNHSISQQMGLAHKPTARDPSPISSSDREDLEKTSHPNIGEHPAYRNASHDRTVSEPVNPLPSARRSPQDMQGARQHQQIVIPSKEPNEGGYRIPGPYVQEYRSPRSARPSEGQDSSLPPQEDFEDNFHGAVPSAGRVVTPTPTGMNQSWEQRHDNENLRGQPFAGTTHSRSRSASRSRSRLGDAPSSQASGHEYVGEEGKKRRGFFKFGNRSNSPSRQGNGGAVGSSFTQEPPNNRKLSVDMLRPSTFGGKPPTDSKKKRSSGFGGLFGKSGAKEKEESRSGRNTPSPLPQDPPLNYSSYGPPGKQAYQPTAAIEPDRAMAERERDPYLSQQHPSGTVNAQNIVPDSAYQETRGLYGPNPQLQDQKRVPDNSWQNASGPTLGYGRAQNTAVPATQTHHNNYPAPMGAQAPSAPVPPSIPTTRANRDISYGQDRPYVPSTSPMRQRGGSPAHPRADMVDHVKDLHKRSRSPRLGRPLSDEHMRGGSDYTSSQSTSQGLSPNPASQLGMFSNKKMSPGGGIPRPAEDQEKPWTIGLPDGGEDDHSETDFHSRGRDRRPEASYPASAATEAAVISPATPQQHGQTQHAQHGQHRQFGDIVSPVTAVEPKGPHFHPTAAATRHDPSMGIAQREQPNVISDRIERQEQLGKSPGVEQLSVPPTISSAPQIPDPTAESREVAAPSTSHQSHQVPVRSATPTVSTTTGAHAPSAPVTSDTAKSGPVSSAPALAPAAVPLAPASLIPTSSATAPSQAARSVRQSLIEHKPEESTKAPVIDSNPPKRLTVAEQIMGRQPAARGTVPEHRSTTPVPKSPAPSIGTQSKTPTWPEEKPSTATVSTTSHGGTSVVTTTMRTGSKPGRSTVKTNAFVVDSNPPSRASSNVGGTNRGLTGGNSLGGNSLGPSAVPATTGPSPLSPINTNTNANGHRTRGLASTSDAAANGARLPQHPGARVGGTGGKSFDAVELPGSRPDGYESEEEVVMSATAYPGQEWIPEFAQGVNWDD